MFAGDAPAMDAPAMLPASMSNAAPATRPALTIGVEPAPTVVLIEVEVKLPA